MQDATKVALGSTRSNIKDVACFDVDPASFLAGLCVSLGSDGLPSLLKSAGMRYGISLGRSLSDYKKTDICQAGLKVPVRAALKRATGIITISSYANLLTTTPDTIEVGGVTFTAQSGAATLGQAVFRAATSNTATATSLAAQINAHATASTKVFALDNGDGTVTLYARDAGVGSTGTGNDVAVTYTDNGGGNIGITLSGLTGGKLSGGSNDIADIGYVTIGAKMYINDTTGEADIGVSGMSTISDAVYVAAPLTGVAEDLSEVAAVLVDMQGGL